MRGLFILLFIAFCLYLFLNVEPGQLDDLLRNQSQTEQGESTNLEEQAVIQSKIQSTHTADGIASFIGNSEKSLLEIYGEPVRKDLSAYDYEWYIYNNYPDEYVQFGVENGRVVTAFSTGSNSNNSPFQTGQSYDSLNEEWTFSNSVTVLQDDGSYRFEMKEEDLLTRPLLLLEDVYVQLYFDSFDKKLSSVRYLNAETLIKQRPYELVYRGPLLEPRELSSEEWGAVEAGAEQQVIDFTNMIRARFDLAPVEWHEETADVAYLHSKDMKDADYFSHTSPTTGSLSDRLTTGNVPFQYAGENIAAQYVDGIAAVEGWLNSEGHRKTLLNGRFTHLGVGVKERYYTQNFIETW